MATISSGFDPCFRGLLVKPPDISILIEIGWRRVFVVVINPIRGRIVMCVIAHDAWGYGGIRCARPPINAMATTVTVTHVQCMAAFMQYG
jgi:hypothetical protein